uniref:FAD-binding domain-containing protein n=1 Tax=Rhizophagus irregularis (strain DAOM 181602 / DAOM 197198 / MUCL 43194) TaxID=747089 RepID=U9SUH1_RHIID
MQQDKIPTIIIVGAGLGGLSLYHALIKNKDKREFNVKIFERESSPTDRWQGYHIGLSNYGAQSLLNCIPSSIASNLPKATPNTVPDVETHGIIITDQVGNVLLAPPTKPFKDFYELAKISRGLSSMIIYRDRLRDVLLDDVPVQWNKKCTKYVETQEGVWVFFEDGTQEFCNILVGADGINSPIRKQKLPELQIVNYGITHVGVDISIPKHLMDRASKIHGNVLARKTLGTKGDSTFMMTRLIPIKQEQNDEKNEPHYRATLVYSYPSELDNVDTESEKAKVDDNDPASVIEHVKVLIRTLRPDCELTDLLLELWDLAPKTIPNDPIKFPFKNYNPVQRRMMRDIDPMSIKSWTSSRVVLLGDAVHAMSPILGLGANNAIQDADKLSQALLKYTDNNISFIEEYEKEMLKRTSADVLKSRNVTFKTSTPLGPFGVIVRDRILKVINVMINFYSFADNLIFKD